MWSENSRREKSIHTNTTTTECLGHISRVGSSNSHGIRLEKHVLVIAIVASVKVDICRLWFAILSSSGEHSEALVLLADELEILMIEKGLTGLKAVMGEVLLSGET